MNKFVYHGTIRHTIGCVNQSVGLPYLYKVAAEDKDGVDAEGGEPELQT